MERVNPRVLVVDSIQTTYSDDLDSAAGNVSQVKHTAQAFQQLAKSSGIAVFLVGHVTKEGSIAGPRVLEHIVDTVLYMEGDAYQAFRLLRSVKNRFGATSEVGVFEMRGSGMVEVRNPSEAVLAERMVNAPGSRIVVTMEGTRRSPRQALATPPALRTRAARPTAWTQPAAHHRQLTRRAGIRRRNGPSGNDRRCGDEPPTCRCARHRLKRQRPPATRRPGDGKTAGGELRTEPAPARLEAAKLGSGGR